MAKRTKAANPAESTETLVETPLEATMSDAHAIPEEEIETPAPVETKAKAKAKPKAKAPAPEVEVEESAIPSPAPTIILDAALALPIKENSVAVADLLNLRKASRASVFSEINEAEERANKKKYSEIKPAETLTRALRGADRRAEESQEEMEARINRLLQEEDRSNADPSKEQLCTKCGLFPVSTMFVIDRNLGFCDECASLLRLGETKEAKTFEFGIGNNDAEAEEDDAAY
jgi:hypothetical protein